MDEDGLLGFAALILLVIVILFVLDVNGTIDIL